MMAKSIEPDLDQAVACIDKGFIELHEYLRMRQDAENYLANRPHALRVLSCIRLRFPDLDYRFKLGQLPIDNIQIT